MLDREATWEDKLSALPSELLHIICNYLFVEHQADKAFFVPHQTKLKCAHALDALAATSRLLRAEVNDWALHWLLQYKCIASEKKPTAKQKGRTFNALRGRHGLLQWSIFHCIFCGKSTQRSAIMVNGFRCCRQCDTKEWPDKITKTNAQAEYDLREHQLLPHRYTNTPLLRKHQERFPNGVPRIRYGTYVSCGVQTTMFLREDVQWLATQYHPDLEHHLLRRKQIKEERARKREDKKHALARGAKGSSAEGSVAANSSGASLDDPQYVG